MMLTGSLQRRCLVEGDCTTLGMLVADVACPSDLSKRAWHARYGNNVKRLFGVSLSAQVGSPEPTTIIQGVPSKRCFCSPLFQ
jgi:hypothetical protein